MTFALKEPPAAQAWLITFADRPAAAEAPFMREPRAAWLHVETRDASAMLGDASAPESAADCLAFVFLPAGATTPYELQHQAETWMESRPGETGDILKVQFRNERVLWRAGRAVCIGSPQAAEEVFAAVVRFSFCHRELARLEREVWDSLATLEAHADISRHLTPARYRREGEVDAMRQRAVAMRVAYLRLQAALEKPPGDIAGMTRRLFLELALQADALDRLRVLNDSIEVMDEHYKHLGEQFAEYSYFAREQRVVVLIFIVLLVELALSIEPVESLVESWWRPVGAFLGLD